MRNVVLWEKLKEGELGTDGSTILKLKFKYTIGGNVLD